MRYKIGTTVKQIAKLILPAILYVVLSNIKNKFVELKYIILASIGHRIALYKLRHRKGAIKVVFFATFDSTWKYDSLYRKMMDSQLFEPIILICPIVNYGFDNMIKRMRDCELFFRNKGYEYIRAYNEVDNHYIDVKKDINPDIIFYTNPYSGLIDSRYYIKRFSSTLTCYVPYFFAYAKENNFFNLLFHKLIWRYYLENEFVKIEYKNVLNRKLNNCRSVGYPSFDEFKQREVHLKETHNVKRIIWAPHHLIDPMNMILRDGFLSLNEVMFELADFYNGQIEFIFRPHPILKNKLYNRPDWGVERTDAYYHKWENHPFCSINEHGNYIDLFYSSDAMIHDCCSFLSEYLYVNKPVLFTDNTDFKSNHYFSFAQRAADCHYRGGTKDEIIKFIDEVVINGLDSKKNKRDEFIKNYIHPEQCVADNIINDIIDSIEHQRV